MSFWPQNDTKYDCQIIFGREAKFLLRKDQAFYYEPKYAKYQVV